MRPKHWVVLVFAAVIVLMALALAGCGGASPQATSPQTNNSTQQTVPTVSITREPVPRAFSPDNATPEFFKQLLADQRPILLFFYAGWDAASRDMLTDLAAIARNTRYSSVVIKKINIDGMGKWSAIAEQLKVGYIPHTFVFDSNGIVIFDKTGYADDKTLEHAVYDAMTYQHAVSQ